MRRRLRRWRRPWTTRRAAGSVGALVLVACASSPPPGERPEDETTAPAAPPEQKANDGAPAEADETDDAVEMADERPPKDIVEATVPEPFTDADEIVEALLSQEVFLWFPDDETAVWATRESTEGIPVGFWVHRGDPAAERTPSTEEFYAHQEQEARSHVVEQVNEGSFVAVRAVEEFTADVNEVAVDGTPITSQKKSDHHTVLVAEGAAAPLVEVKTNAEILPRFSRLLWRADVPVTAVRTDLRPRDPKLAFTYQLRFFRWGQDQ